MFDSERVLREREKESAWLCLEIGGVSTVWQSQVLSRVVESRSLSEWSEEDERTTKPKEPTRAAPPSMEVGGMADPSWPVSTFDVRRPLASNQDKKRGAPVDPIEPPGRCRQFLLESAAGGAVDSGTTRHQTTHGPSRLRAVVPETEADRSQLLIDLPNNAVARCTERRAE